MSVEATSITVSSGDSTTLTVSSGQATVLNSASTAINVPVYVNLSNNTPAELSNTGSAGTSIFASRADHSHPLTGATFNGGNF